MHMQCDIDVFDKFICCEHTVLLESKLDLKETRVDHLA